ncbi:Kinesin-like protein, partial [Globisporangium splendens]
MRRMSLPKFLTSSSSASSQDGDQQQKECAIKVVIRVRPLNDRELVAKTPVTVNVARMSIQVVNPIVFLDPAYLEAVSSPSDLPMALTERGLAAAVTASECRTFHFDRCFGVNNAAANETEPFAHSYDIDVTTQRPNQELVFEEIGREMIESAFQGFNCTVLAYGQTGSGKTHTMVGEKTTKGKGLIPRVCEALFTAIDARRESEHSRDDESDNSISDDDNDKIKKTLYNVQVSYCEIYKEKVNDLLDSSAASAHNKPRPSLNGMPQPPLSPTARATEGGDGAGTNGSGISHRKAALKVREHPTTGPFVEGLSVRTVASYADITEEMLAGDKLRRVAATLMNAVSSRSHAVFTITFTQTTFDPVTQTSHEKVRSRSHHCLPTSKISMIDLAGSERANASGTSGERLKEGAMINKSLATLGRVISALSKQGQVAERVPYRDSTLTWLLKESLGGNPKTTMIAMISPSSDRVINRAVVNEDKNARIIRQLHQEIQELRIELERAKQARSPARRRSRNSSASAAVILPPTSSVTERDEFQAQLLQEVDELRKHRKQMDEPETAPAAAGATPSPPARARSPRRPRGSIRLSATWPSLVNNCTQLTSDAALAYTLVEGITVFGRGTGASKKKVDENGPQGVGPSDDGVNVCTDTAKDDAKAAEAQEEEIPTMAHALPTAPGSDDRTNSAPSSSLSTETNSLTTRFHHLAARHDQSEDQLSLPYAEIVCSRDNAGGFGVEKYCAIELKVLDANVDVRVNGKRLGACDEDGDDSAAKRAALHHGDLVQFDERHEFRVYVPRAAATAPTAVNAPALFAFDENTKLHSTIECSDPSGKTHDIIESLNELVLEANAICEKWNLNTTFTLKHNDRMLGEEEKKEEPWLIVTKHLDSQRYSVVEWPRPMLEAKVRFLREFAASLEGAETLTMTNPEAIATEEAKAEEEADEEQQEERLSSLERKISSFREPDATTNAEDVSKAIPRLFHGSSEHSEAQPPSSSSSSPTTRSDHISKIITPPPPVPPRCIRLIGQGRIYLPSSLTSSLNGSTIAAVLDGAGHSIGKMYLRLQFTATSTEERLQERRAPFLSRRPSFFSSIASPAPQKAKPGVHIMRIHVDKIVFDVSQHMASDGISLTLKKWWQRSTELHVSGGAGSKTAATGSAGAASTESWSTQKILPFSANHHDPPVEGADQLRLFVVDQAFDTKLPPAVMERELPASKPSGSAETGIQSASSGGPHNFVAFEVWGYSPESRVLSPPTATGVPELPAKTQHQERNQDGIFRPVAVKPDDTLRLHTNQPRRVNIRVTQADQEPFALVSIASVMLSPPLSVSHRTASLSDLTGSDGTGGKGSQWLLSPSSTQDRKQQPHLQSATSTASDPKWYPLEFRSVSEVDSISRSLSISVKWDPKQTPHDAEFADTEGSRSVYRVVLALTTSLSHVPLVISKSIVTEITPVAVSATRRFARELETTRMAWWARESFSREYRLGTWYTADVCVGDPEPPRVLGIEASEAKEEILNDLRGMMVSAVVAGHIKGLLRLERVYELEQVRQQILITARGRNVDPLETDNNGGVGHRKSDTAEDCLTFERVSECLQVLFESNDENEQALEVAKLQSNPQSLFLRRKARTELLLGIQHGNVVDLSPTAHGYTATTGAAGPLDDGSEIVPQFVPWRELHFAHFVTEPSHLASESSGGEMAGFLMLSTAFQIDETAVAVLGSPRVHLRSKTAKPVRAQWERRWFVLKRPFLYAYKSFALKEEIGVVDISKCQLLTPTSSNPADHSHPHHSSLSSSSSSSLSQAASSGSSDVLSTIPFSFQLVSRAGSKCVVWTLQASTSPEMRAWLVAIDPLKIEAAKRS